LIPVFQQIRLKCRFLRGHQSFGTGNKKVAGLWLRPVYEHELLVIYVNGHIAIAGFRMVKPPGRAGTSAVNVRIRFSGCGVIP
jgi:hypothetical protein